MNILAIVAQGLPGHWEVSVMSAPDGESFTMPCATRENAEALAAAINTYALAVRRDYE